jgi:hypothetical protein
MSVLLGKTIPSRPAGEVAQDLYYDAQTEEFERLNSLATRYRGLSIYQAHDRLIYGALAVNLQEADFKFEFRPQESHAPEVVPIWMWTFVIDPVTKRRVYTDPPYLEIGLRNLRGFGVTARPGWEEEAQRLYLPAKCLAAAQDYLARNSVHSYLEP